MTIGLKYKNRASDPVGIGLIDSVSDGWSIWVHLLWAAVALASLQTAAPLLDGVTGGSLNLAGAAFVGAGVILARADRGRTRAPPFGAANTVTLFRVVLVCFLVGYIGQATPLADTWLIVAIAGLALGLDGIDGWLARRSGAESPFGAMFDQETDAALILILCVLAAQTGKAGWWILASGALRYLWVGAGLVLDWMRRPLPFSQRRRVVCVVQVGALIVALIPLSPIALSAPLAGVSLALLLASFAADFAWLAGRRKIKDAVS